MSENATAPARQNAEFTCAHGEMAAVLKIAEFGIDPRHANPAQRGVVIETANGHVTFSTYDFDTAVRVSMACPTTNAPGTSLLDFTELSKTLAALAVGEPKTAAAATEVSLAGDLLSGKDMTVPIGALDPAAYVGAPAPAPATVLLDAKGFRTQLDRVLPAVGTDLTLPALTGIQLTFGAATCTLAATDRYRLAVAELPAHPAAQTPPPGGDTVEINVPGSFLRRLIKPLKDYDGPLGIGVSEDRTYATFTLGHITFSFRLLDGRLPRYERLFPKTVAASLRIDRAALAAATKKCAAVLKAKGADRLTPVSFLWDDDGALTLAPALPEPQDRARLKGIPVPYLTAGASVDLRRSAHSLNHAYLAAALDTFTCDTITIHLPGTENGQGLQKPVLFTAGPDLQGDDYRHLLMAVRLDFTWEL
ncbi:MULTISPECIES: hypothetical protein [unclassified Streptomyces]|uniref:DNA polymerase III subunit beta family protein n=1 Tax=unclassified Streptomyces TaxID=2593676 RepID=UPI0035D6D9A0